MGLFRVDCDMPQLHGVEPETADEGYVMLDHEYFEGCEVLSDGIEPDVLVEVFGDDEDLMVELEEEVVFLVDDFELLKGLFVIEVIVFGLVFFGIV